MDPLRLGLLSTAAINAQILGGASETDRVEIVAVGAATARRRRPMPPSTASSARTARTRRSWPTPSVDAVYIGLPNGLHPQWTMHALEAGKHVLVEKPCTRRAPRPRRRSPPPTRRGCVLMEAFMYRHHPQTAVVRDLVAGGAIGRLQVVKTTFSFALEDLTNVRALPELDGGAMMDVGCYCVERDPPARRRAGARLGRAGDRLDRVDMALHGTLRCADDVIGQFEASFRSPRRQRVEVVGEEGTITIEAPFRVDWGGAVLLARPTARASAAETVDVAQANWYRRSSRTSRTRLRPRRAAARPRRRGRTGPDDRGALRGSAADGRTVELR